MNPNSMDLLIGEETLGEYGLLPQQAIDAQLQAAISKQQKRNSPLELIVPKAEKLNMDLDLALAMWKDSVIARTVKTALRLNGGHIAEDDVPKRLHNTLNFVQREIVHTEEDVVLTTNERL